MAISVAVPVGEDTANALRDRLVAALADLKVGPGTDPDVEMGPLVTGVHRDKVASYIDLGVAGRRRTRRRRPRASAATPATGSSSAAPSSTTSPRRMRIYLEEIFGPVLSIVRAESFEKALQLVNDHEFGNGTAIFTADGNTARTYLHQRQGRHGRHQRPDPGADGLPLLRRLETVPFR